jgi:two-component system OmpR family sensor kinase
MRLRHYMRAHLHRRIFAWFGLSIFLTAGLIAGVMHLVNRWQPNPWQVEVERVSAFVGARFAAVWDDETQRRTLARSVADELDLDVRLLAADGKPLDTFGSDCARPQYTVPVVRDQLTLGRVEVCAPRHYAGSWWRLAVPLFCGALVLWGASGKLSRRLTRPLTDLARVARDIGDGKLQSRARLRGREPGEVGKLAEAVNDMAAKIERQMAEQRELLAAVSHELRTPLTRMRVLIELAREKPAPLTQLNELDREIAEIDNLVGELLASARLDFSALRRRPLSAVATAARALDRAGEQAELLQNEAGAAEIQADASLIARALSNLLDNAKKHGGGARALRIKTRPGRVAFEVEDGGPGFSDEAARRLFQPFSGGATETSSLGLGLALVRRIAEAHGGTAYAENISGGGARVGFEVTI